MSLNVNSSDRVGVLLFNLGGPETLDDVKPFLFNLFSDPDIIRLPWRPLQKPLAWLISTLRHGKSRGYYEQIGGGSPLRRITEAQAEGLRAELSRRGIDSRVYVGMRYWKPFTADAVAQIRRDGIDRLVLLPLYPQYSISTTGSSLNELERLASSGELTDVELSAVRSWEADPEYVASLAASVAEELGNLADSGGAQTHIVFSAHSVPVRYIEEGDPYLEHTQRTVQLVMERIGSQHPHHLAFQSKVGPVKWLEPSTDQMIRRLAAQGVRRLLLVPVSFVSEHIETLYELDILYRNLANEVGLAHYHRVPALNLRPDFISALAGLVERELAAR